MVLHILKTAVFFTFAILYTDIQKKLMPINMSLTSEVTSPEGNEFHPTSVLCIIKCLSSTTSYCSLRSPLCYIKGSPTMINYYRAWRGWWKDYNTIKNYQNTFLSFRQSFSYFSFIFPTRNFVISDNQKKTPQKNYLVYSACELMFPKLANCLMISWT